MQRLSPLYLEHAACIACPRRSDVTLLLFDIVNSESHSATSEVELNRLLGLAESQIFKREINAACLTLAKLLGLLEELEAKLGCSPADLNDEPIAGYIRLANAIGSIYPPMRH